MVRSFVQGRRAGATGPSSSGNLSVVFGPGASMAVPITSSHQSAGRLMGGI